MIIFFFQVKAPVSGIDVVVLFDVTDEVVLSRIEGRTCTIWHCILSAELTKTHSFWLFFWRFFPLGEHITKLFFNFQCVRTSNTLARF